MKYKARLFVINPLGNATFFPNAVIQADLDDPNASADDRKVRLIGHDWAISLPHQRLGDVTADDLRAAMKLPISVPLLLTSERDLPDYAWISSEMLTWAEAWQNEAVADWKDSQSEMLEVARAS